MRKNLYLIMIGVVSMFLTGCGADQALKKGDKFYAMGEYFDAANQYKKAYSADTSQGATAERTKGAEDGGVLQAHQLYAESNSCV